SQLAVVWLDEELKDAPQGPRQRIVLEALRGRPLPVAAATVIEEASSSYSQLRSLEAQGRIRLERIEIQRSPWQRTPLEAPRFNLTREQSEIVEALRKRLGRREFFSYLVHGVTGSGKTEIYLHLIKRALQLGLTSLVLVPEIGLTPQISGRFRSWFGPEVAILHSGLSGGERFDQWRRIRSGESRVVIGTRSAVFAPLERLGLIIVDEEHDSSFKQEELPRYHGRDTAIRRAQMASALVVLGSATPQLETYHRAVAERKAGFGVLKSRILDRPLPDVHIVDLREEFQRRGRESMLSELLQEKIGSRLQRGEQTMVLLNRRGYASSVFCRACGHTEACRNCSISLTYHRTADRLSCHYCGYARSVPKVCSECGREFIFFAGQGTEKLEEHLAGIFPNARLERLDRDRVRRKGSHERILHRFAAGQIDVLVGTQMISKGHDFPGVTLVGVLGADQSLRFADFRAAEKTFQLLTQVAGRAGRGEQPGEVVVETYYPAHYSLKFACRQDYESFYREELPFRRRFRYPPFTALANLILCNRQRRKGEERSALLAELLLKARDRFSDSARMRILGPAPAALERLKKEFRLQILVKSTNRKELRQVIVQARDEFLQTAGESGRVTIDIDPVNLL
ncbi:MAG TPA: primosomal protein N', partial [Acidobacteriota bacterium]|nr:primosomal protein N' [Acidobacteriota bacterium]